MNRLGIAVTAAWLAGSAGSVSATTFLGEYWDADFGLDDIAAADDAIAEGPATATFSSSLIDYPVGLDMIVDNTTTLASFLGSDAVTLSGAGETTLEESVFRFTGYVDMAAGTNELAVASDDGFRLTIGGVQIAEFSGLRTFSETVVMIDAGSGPQPFELIYFENDGITGVEVRIDGQLASASDPKITAVPIPGSLLMLMTATGFLGSYGLRRAGVSV